MDPINAALAASELQDPLITLRQLKNLMLFVYAFAAYGRLLALERM